MSPKRRTAFAGGAIDAFDLATVGLFALLIAIIALTYGSYAVSNDEGVQQRYGELIISYYASGFTDRALFDYGNLYLYGGLFDILATLIARASGGDIYVVRHLLCAFAGVGGIAATWAGARLIAGARAGFMAAVMLTLCGVWYGAMYNHTKDITFAAAFIGATVTMLRLARDLPRPRWRDIVLLGVLLGAALGLRALGLLLLALLAVVMAVATADAGANGNGARVRAFARATLALSPALVIACGIMVVAWPWAGLHVLNPVRALFAFTHFEYGIATLLAGHVYMMNEVPRWYIPAYLAVRLPLVVWAGLSAATAFAVWPRLSRPLVTGIARREIGVIAFSAALPVVCHVITHGPAFSGMRHFLFVVPAMALLAGVGCELAIRRLSRWRPAVAATAGTLLALEFASQAGMLVRLHPHEYLYYNRLVGGLAGANGRYDTDYWVNILPDAMRALEDHIAHAEREQRWPRPPFYTIGVCADRVAFDHENRLGPRLRPTEDWDNADFFVSPTHMGCDQRGTGATIVRIERMGVLIGVVKQGPHVGRRPPAGGPSS